MKCLGYTLLFYVVVFWSVLGEITIDMTIEEKCAKSKALLIPHPDECQLYYNCSRPFDKVDPYFEPFLEECEHPKLFDNVTKMCTDYKNVKCGNRIERKWVCDYRKSQCPVSHCRPCWVDNPSCIGLEDGIHADPRGPSFYMHCKDERAVGKGQCVDKETGQPLKLIQGKCQ